MMTKVSTESWVTEIERIDDHADAGGFARLAHMRDLDEIERRFVQHY